MALRPRTLLASIAPFAAALAVLAVMGLQALHRSPYVTNPRQRRYGQNWPGDLSTEITLGAWEMLALMLILRPWSYRRSWGRALFALVLAIPWTLFMAMVGMHAGSVNGAHLVWRTVIVLALLVLTTLSAVEAARARRSKAGG